MPSASASTGPSGVAFQTTACRAPSVACEPGINPSLLTATAVP
jgi:hypothetical protein